jgi:nicotinate-nucleotide pyrophosphorylase (carboxylating)
VISHDPSLHRLIELALEEDLLAGDVTTESCVPEGTKGRARVIAKERLVLAGVDVFEAVFERVDPTVQIRREAAEGDAVEPGTVVLTLEGEAASLLMGERIALNFLQRLSGIASQARELSAALKAHPHVRLVDTRKTTPGWRRIEKLAVRTGGAHNHRGALFDGVMIKDNHIAAAGGIVGAVARARENVHHLLKIEVETTTLEEVDEALAAGADVILLDNMDDELMTAAVNKVRAHERAGKGRVLTEASGNMTLERLPGAAATGVDLISMGALTHSARAMDLSMKLDLVESSS